MNRNGKWKRMGALLLAGSLAVFGSGAVQAEPRDTGAEFSAAILEPAAIDPVLLEKQKEIDAFVFDTGADELAKRGFKVTHTGPVGDRIEIGILPYEESHAEYLYKTFGRDQVSVVEGVQATTMTEPEMTILPAPEMTILPAPADGGGAAPANPGMDLPAVDGGASVQPDADVSDSVPPVPEPTEPNAAADPAGPATDPNQTVSSEAGDAGSGNADGAQTGGDARSANEEAAELSATTGMAETPSQDSSLLASPALYVTIGVVLLAAVVALMLGRKRLAAKK
jgi:hypothetical protein